MKGIREKSKTFLELEKRIKDEKIVLDATGLSIMKKIRKCSDDEIHDFINHGVIPAIKLNDKEMKLIQAGFLPVERGGHRSLVPGERTNKK